MRDREQLEKMMEELGCTGERITNSGILDRIVGVEYQTVTLCGVSMMFCGIALKTENPDRPFVITGNPSVCIDPANWREQIGQKVSFENTFDKIWQLEAYRFVTAPKAPAREFPVRDGFKLFDAKPIQREAYQLTTDDIYYMAFAAGQERKGDKCSMSPRALVKIGEKDLSFSFHCKPEEIKAGDYVVFINESDSYHCSEEVFNERNIT